MFLHYLNHFENLLTNRKENETKKKELFYKKQREIRIFRSITLIMIVLLIDFITKSDKTYKIDELIVNSK